MSKISEILNQSRKIVIKIGSNVLSDAEGRVNKEVVGDIVDQVSGLLDQRRQVLIVSSGAGIFGVGAINKWQRRGDINYKQALCAIGQVELMMAYKEFFAGHGHHVAQMLLTNDDFNDDERKLHMRNTLFTLVDEGVVPIINENDTVSTEEFFIGDNDRLSALTANLWSADLLVCLSDIDGVFDKDPKENSDAKLVETVTDPDSLLKKINIGEKSTFGTGGIATKIAAAKTAGEMLIPTILLNGKKPGIIRDALEGKETGTAFLWE